MPAETTAGGGDGLVQRYEDLRARALAGGAQGFALGIGLLMTKGMSAWMGAAQALPAPSPPSPAPTLSAPPATVASEVVRVLAAMTMACVTKEP